MAPSLAPCTWDPIPCGCDLFLESGESGEFVDQNAQNAVETAQYVLWALSGRQFGCCELTFRPCRRDCRTGLEGAWGAYLSDGSWFNYPCRSCSSRCSCTEVQEVQLPHAPACSILEVTVDGEPLPAGDFRLEDAGWLVLNGGLMFPACQDMSVPLGQPGTFGVRYEYGTPPPTAGRRAVGALACEIIKACRNDSGCCLPKRTQQYNRAGMSVVMLDPFEFFEKGRTGIYEVDLFLNAANPKSRPSGARILSPDMDDRRREEW